MAEQKLTQAVGIDQSAEDALARAGVRTIQQLAEADPEALAMASGVPVDRIRDWQHKARRAGARRGPSPVAKGWMVGLIGVLIAVLLGSALIAIGSKRIEEAEKTRVAAESKLQIALGFTADEAIDELRQARLALHNENWGSAQSVLSRVEDKVTLMEQVAPDRRRDEMSELRKLMGDLQTAIGAQSQDAAQKLDSLEAALDKMRQAR